MTQSRKLTRDVMQLTDSFNNCYCSSVQLSYPMWGGYAVLEPFESVVDNFNVLSYWIPAP
jgi:hypothetical protein